jgi:hypothetical protein
MFHRADLRRMFRLRNIPSGSGKAQGEAMNKNLWKYGLILGAGFALGAAGALLLSRNPALVRKTLAAVLSRGIDLKDKAAVFMETAKENVEDITAEARHASEQRKSRQETDPSA